MVNSLIEHIARFFKEVSKDVLLVENNDRFLYRPDVVKVFSKYGIEIVYGSAIQRRVRFELREKDGILVLLSQQNSDYLEDIRKASTAIEFHLKDYLQGYHIPSVLNLELEILDELFRNKPLVNLNRENTIISVQKAKEHLISVPEKSIDIVQFEKKIDSLLSESIINWRLISHLIADAIAKSIGKSEFDTVYRVVNKANDYFLKNISEQYQQIKNSSSVKKPRIVSKILDYLNFNYKDKKIALLVVDGMAHWQYELIKNSLPGSKKEDIIYSWIPSITQLSRQAIFRGSIPKTNYRQNPQNEEKLWYSYWQSQGLPTNYILYQHENVDFSNLNHINKFAVVIKDLDDKMHGSTDYKDLHALTTNWVVRSKLSSVIGELLKNGFTIFLTSDHGNIQAKGWRGLKGKEKLGTNKSGSKSQRHIEYSDKWLKDQFVSANPEIYDFIVDNDNAILIKSDLSFSNKETLVTHGGAHILEVLIPFIEIKDEE